VYGVQFRQRVHDVRDNVPSGCHEFDDVRTQLRRQILLCYIGNLSGTTASGFCPRCRRHVPHESDGRQQHHIVHQNELQWRTADLARMQRFKMQELQIHQLWKCTLPAGRRRNQQQHRMSLGEFVERCRRYDKYRAVERWQFDRCSRGSDESFWKRGNESHGGGELDVGVRSFICSGKDVVQIVDRRS